MPRPVALHIALDLAHTPTLGTIIQREPLPDGVLEVIKIAAGNEETTAEAVDRTHTTPTKIQHAAAVYLQTALFSPQADSYRVLGVQRTAQLGEIRQHLRWLMLWLHPDRQHDAWQSKLAEKVLGAWDELKTPEHRARYDRLHPPPDGVKRRSRGLWRRPWLPWFEWPQTAQTKQLVWLQRLGVGFAFGILLLTVIVVGSTWYDRLGTSQTTTGFGEIVEVPSSANR